MRVLALCLAVLTAFASTANAAPRDSDPLEARRHLHLELEPETPPPSDYAHAPTAIREFVEVASTISFGNTSDGYSHATKPVEALGPDAAPWLKVVLLDGSKNLHLLARTLVAGLLQKYGRSDDLMDAIRAPGFAPFGVQFALASAVNPRFGGTGQRYLPDIEKIARTSLNPSSRIAATWILMETKDRRYAPVFIANLSYSRIASRIEAARGAPLPPRKAEALRRILGTCEKRDDYEVRSHSIEALQKLADPRTIPAMLDAAERAPIGLHRRSLLRALDAITQQNFGDPPGTRALKTESACEASENDVWRIADSTGDAAALEEIAGRIEATLAGEMAATPDRRVLAAWRSWLEAQHGGLPERFALERVAELQFPQTRTTIVLFASGQLRVSGPQPGVTNGAATFRDFDDYERYIAAVSPEAIGSAPTREQSEALGWIVSEALPKLKADWAAQSQKPK